MKFDYKKGILATLAAIFLGSSCCWIGALALWVGGTVTLGTLASYFEDMRIFALIFLFGALIFLILRKRMKRNN